MAVIRNTGLKVPSIRKTKRKNKLRVLGWQLKLERQIGKLKVDLCRISNFKEETVSRRMKNQIESLKRKYDLYIYDASLVVINE